VHRASLFSKCFYVVTQSSFLLTKISAKDRVGKNPGFLKKAQPGVFFKKAQPGGFFGFYWVF
jgi:hypothetical protein